MILKKIQNQLQSLYQIRIEENVENFTLRQPKSGSETKVGSRMADEALLIKHSPTEVQLGLFVAPRVLQTLKKYDPFLSFGLHNLRAFLIAVEGVSHFLYFLKNAKKNFPVSRLEMEIQAEIDKFLLAAFFYFFHQRRVPPFLFSYLFEKMELHPALSPGEKSRYQEANKMAQKFCATLDSHFIRQGLWKKLLQKARHFYNLNHWEKLRFLT